MTRLARFSTKRLSLWRKATASKFLISSVAILALSSGAGAHQRSRSLAYHELISGAAAPSSFDANGDGIKGHYVTFSGHSTLGPVHGALLVEYDFTNLGPDPACPAGTLKLPILVSAGNRAVTGTESQLFMRDDTSSALFCLDTSTGAFTMALKGVFAGGMGRLAGATGAYEYKGSGNVLLQDATGSPFGGFVLETKGRLTVPDVR
jgi:hypothetical protein